MCSLLPLTNHCNGTLRELTWHSIWQSASSTAFGCSLTNASSTAYGRCLTKCVIYSLTKCVIYSLWVQLDKCVIYSVRVQLEKVRHLRLDKVLHQQPRGAAWQSASSTAYGCSLTRASSTAYGCKYFKKIKKIHSVNSSQHIIISTTAKLE